MTFPDQMDSLLFLVIPSIYMKEIIFEYIFFFAAAGIVSSTSMTGGSVC